MCEVWENEDNVGFTKGETHACSARPTPESGDVGLEIGFSSNCSSEGTTTTMNIDPTEKMQDSPLGIGESRPFDTRPSLLLRRVQ
jgi:hypothetical protein